MKKIEIINLTEILDTHHDTEIRVGGDHANFSKHFGLKRIGVHYFSISPGHRTSRPHAESLEEEFVYVISGKIDLWLNGRIKKLESGDCIGFPAGTGVGHTFINNSLKEAELFVAGDRTKKDNKYHFHLESNLKDECKDKWWEDMPEQELGSHNGLPGPYEEFQIDSKIEILNGLANIPTDSYSYPGDNETFSNGVCLSRKFGMKSIAVWLEKLPPGKRTSWPHAHSVEEEFVYIIRGYPTLWLNGETQELSDGDAVDFKAGSGIAHTLINEDDNDVYYICVGECEPKNDKIIYPLHPRRNQEVKKEGGFWETHPTYDLSKNHDAGTEFTRSELRLKKEVFTISENIVNLAGDCQNKIWGMWLPKKRIEKVENSNLELKSVSEYSLWDEMFKLRSVIESEFGDFSNSEIQEMINIIKKLEDKKLGFWFLAYKDEIVVGEIGFVPIEYNGKKYYRLQDVDILPEHRGRDIGNQLLNAICLKLQRLDPDAICLRADVSDWKKDWYLRYGFDKILEE